MSKQAMEMALKALDNLYSQRRDATEQKLAAIAALKEAIKQHSASESDAEPVAWICYSIDGVSFQDYESTGCEPLYTSAPEISETTLLEGWQLVPTWMAASMYRAASACWSANASFADNLKAAYKAMLAASPQPTKEK